MVTVWWGCSGEKNPLSTGGNPGGNDTTTPPPAPPDTIAPAAVIDARLIYDPLRNFVHLDWTAPADNTPTDTVDSYEIRFSTAQGLPPPDFWNLSIRVSDPPDPAGPGTTQRYTFDDPQRARELYVGIRSFDAAGNRSGPSDIVKVAIPGFDMTGRCVAALTGLPIEGLAVRVVGGGGFDHVTDANGEFVQLGLEPGGHQVQVQTGSATVTYHTLTQPVVLQSDSTVTFVMIAAQTTVAPDLNGQTLLSFFRQLTRTENAPFILAKWRRTPVRVFIPSFTNTNGVDYVVESRAAVQRWMDRTGVVIFEFVNSPPDTGIVVQPRTRAEMGGLTAVTRHTTATDLHPIKDVIEVVDDMSTSSILYKVMLHEFGHTIRLGHARTKAFIMFNGLPLPNDISDDERDVVILHQALPVRVNMSYYQ